MPMNTCTAVSPAAAEFTPATGVNASAVLGGAAYRPDAAQGRCSLSKRAVAHMAMVGGFKRLSHCYGSQVERLGMCRRDLRYLCA